MLANKQTKTNKHDGSQYLLAWRTSHNVSRAESEAPAVVAGPICRSRWVNGNEAGFNIYKKYFSLNCDQSNYSSRIVFSNIPIEFVQTGISAIQSADPENPTVEPNLKWIGHEC